MKRSCSNAVTFPGNGTNIERDIRILAEIMKRVGVIGWPVKHSRSPIIHRYWLERHAIAGCYEAFAVPPDELARFVRSMPGQGLAGANVTIPHKETVYNLVEAADDVSRNLRAVNTIAWQEGRLHGKNTDGYGFKAAIVAAIPDWSFPGCKAVVLGAGGAARAIIAALLAERVSELIITNRTQGRAEAIASLLDGGGTRLMVADWSRRNEAMNGADLVVNTTSLGMSRQPALDVDLSKVAQGAVIYDVVYTPLVTPLLRQASEKGLRTVNGLGMLLHQAVPAFEWWFGIRPEVTRELYDLIVTSLDS